MLKELDSRETDSISVTLLWDSSLNRTMVRLVDSKDGTDETFHVPAQFALDAFAHPFCYLNR